MTVLKVSPADGVTLPKMATKSSACFDLEYNPSGKNSYKGYNSFNSEFERPLGDKQSITIMPGDRVLVPTGLIFDIPEGYFLKVYIRSSVALKYGLVLANSTGIIDEDYTKETFILLLNTGSNPYIIQIHDRLAQVELCKTPEVTLEASTAPEQKTDRVGGLGSTGKNKGGRPKGSSSKPKDPPIEGDPTLV